MEAAASSAILSSPQSLTHCSEPVIMTRPGEGRHQGKIQQFRSMTGCPAWSELLTGIVEDKLMQLPGYLNGRTLQEWHLLSRAEQQSYPLAVYALRARLDSTNRTMAAQEFRHKLQRKGVAEFIQRLRRLTK